MTLPIERISTRYRFVLEARERLRTKKYGVVKNLPLEEIESGLNIQ